MRVFPVSDSIQKKHKKQEIGNRGQKKYMKVGDWCYFESGVAA